MIDPLVERARQGDAAALESLLTQVAPAVRRFGLRMCRDPHDADDALQDTLLSIATHLGEFEGRASFTSWVFTLVRTACARRRRGLKNQPGSDEGLASSRDRGPDPEELAARAELQSAVLSALDRLPDEYREVVHLRDVEGLSAAETAAVVGASTDAVKSRLHRARAALREALRPVIEGDAAAASPGCPDVMTWWSRRLEDEVSTRDCEEIEKHVAGCPSCARACSSLRQAISACQQSAQAPLDPAVQTAVRAAVRRVAAGAR